MINWILGGVIAVVTVYIIVRMISRYKKGESGCDCGGCSQKCSKKQ